MRLTIPRPPLRAVLLIAVGWVGLRMWMLWPGNEAENVAARKVAHVVQLLPPSLIELAPGLTPISTRRYHRRTVLAALRRSGHSETRDIPLQPTTTPAVFARASEQPRAPIESGGAKTPPHAPRDATPDRSRWSGWAYVFARPGSGRTLAAGGQLGGSQVAARMAYRLTDNLAVAARAYTPLGAKGAEAAVGADVRIGPVHLIGERRIAIDGQARDAWSAYATAGLYRKTGPLMIDAYAQAGIVGARRRDGFVDGAARLGTRVGATGAIIGAGAWGAAQPGVARIDIGPRAAWRESKTGFTASVEGRFRIAGDARSGSGVAITIARDF